MTWSPQQDAALRDVRRWLQDRNPQVFRLFGYAGTGKTTLAKELAESVQGKVEFAAFTGKAAQVLKSKGCTDARTIHSLIYKLDSDKDGKMVWSLNRKSDAANASLIIIDECSMVDEAMGRDLLSFGTPILVLGDPAQLPPLRGQGFFTDVGPEVMLTEIHRQARDNPIIQLASTVRESGRLVPGHYGKARVITHAELTNDDVLSADQVLVGTNAKRRAINDGVRCERGFKARWPGYSESFPTVGERLVCLRNNHAKGTLNGGLWTTLDARQKDANSSISITARPEEGGAQISVDVRPEFFQGREDQLPWYVRKRSDEFDFGYALTVHKAQGSQWRNVVLYGNQASCFRDYPERWLYTGITRASEYLTVVV